VSIIFITDENFLSILQSVAEDLPDVGEFQEVVSVEDGQSLIDF